MTKRLENKIAIITGAAQGTGAAIARTFVSEGAKVCIADVKEEAGQILAEELGPAALFKRTDVSQSENWRALVQSVSRNFGDATILVNNAAVLDVSLIEDIDEATLVRLFKVNQLGAILGIKAVLPGMRESGYGSIINIGSSDGVMAQDLGLIAYGSTKFALRGVTKMAAMELGRYAIRVNCLNPDAGNIEMSKPFLPADINPDEAMQQHVEQILRPPPWAKGFHRYAEIASMALYLASDESSGCTGGDFPVDGGYTAGRCFR